jgi:hypothetical protein
MPPFCEFIVEGSSNSSLEDIRKEVSYDILNDSTEATEESSTSSSSSDSNDSPMECSSHSRIQFNDVTEVHEIPSRKDFDEETITTCYYTKKEIALFKPVEYRSFSKCCKGECLRGFEGWAGRGGIIRRKVTLSTRKAVITEQKEQLDNGQVVDPVALARFYGTLAQHSEQEAQTVALADELYTRRYVYELPCSPELLAAEELVRETVHLKYCSCNHAKAPKPPKKHQQRFKQHSFDSIAFDTKPSSLQSVPLSRQHSLGSIGDVDAKRTSSSRPKFLKFFSSKKVNA